MGVAFQECPTNKRFSSSVQISKAICPLHFQFQQDIRKATEKKHVASALTVPGTPSDVGPAVEFYTEYKEAEDGDGVGQGGSIKTQALNEEVAEGAGSNAPN
uniref:Uncharacterized protein n=1 Tax=Sphaerodactylus townsendi TaxID=933632 RepID=A0ACB8EB83_9SAUR